ncbi:outer membrane protein assembly factor BamB family protein [Halogeometricum limi]|uniref:Outer membrane protein assembly factor BamB, contains PQQ-like beta-propeller repeat n=1 Tax=Halogeometricum limi TaxID=555875 RepID=A0A1I6HJP2_9EURY|nr:PQQ-binding-like beta-propeller repeat protein [Halogeometricum limi]SFR54683.1 Outer membrane protein assembly factor BamB, contains PQQ-like beta-propeller repeat [Halogeometricum limi]
MPSRRHLLAGVGSLATAGLAGCLDAVDDRSEQFSPGSDHATDWPMPRYDAAQTAFAPDAVAPRNGATERWRTEARTPNGSPVVAGGVVYLPRAAGLVAYDAGSGEERWTYAPEDSPWPGSPLVVGDTLYVPFGSDIGLHAIDANTGERRWSREDVDARTTPVPARDDDAVYAGSQRTGLHRLDGETGESMWERDVFGVPSALASDAFGGLFVGTEGGHVYAFSDVTPESPREGWREDAGSAVESLLPTDEGLLVHTFSDPLRCRQGGLHAGSVRWEVEQEYANSPPVHAGVWVFSAGYDSVGSVREYDAAVGWRASGRYDRAAPVAAGDRLYVGNERGVHAFELSGGTGIGQFRLGGKRWSQSLSTTVEGLAVGDGALFAVTSGDDENPAALVAFDPQ